MKKLLVILDAPTNVDYQSSGSIENALRSAKGNQELPEGVSRILGNSFLIDTHTCLPFFVSLVNNANTYHLRVAVFSVDDENLLSHDLFQGQTIVVHFVSSA